MPSVSETNSALWDTLGRIYQAQKDQAGQALADLEAVALQHPAIADDPRAAAELNSALARQKGQLRYAESQLTLVDVMTGYWDRHLDDPKTETKRDDAGKAGDGKAGDGKTLAGSGPGSSGFQPGPRPPAAPVLSKVSAPTAPVVSAASAAARFSTAAARAAQATNPAPIAPSAAVAAKVAE